MEQPPGITLIGMPGVGKSTVGRLLANRLGWPLLDVDGEVELLAGLPLGQAAPRLGAERILRLQEDVLAGRESLSRTVISTPGSIIFTRAMERLARESLVVHLDLPPDQLEARLSAQPNPDRVIIGLGPDGLAGVHRERLPLYRRWAQLTVAGSGRPEQLAGLLAGLCAHERPPAG